MGANQPGRSESPESPGWPFVGREGEFTQLTARLAAAVNGAGSIVHIEGEAGIGKTRLVAELQRWARPRGVQVRSVNLRALEGGRPFGAWLELFREVTGTTQQRLVAEFSAAVHRVLLDRDHRLPSRFVAVDAALALIDELATSAPQLLVFEDGDQLDGPSRDGLVALCRRVSRLPVMVVVSRRTAPADALFADWRDRAVAAGAVELRLAPLSLAETNELARSVLGLPVGPVLSELLEGAHGNPFVAVTLLSALVEQDAVVEEDGTAHVTGAVSLDRAHRAIVERLAQLPPSHTEFLQVLAAFGRAAELDECAPALSDPAAAPVIVNELLARGLISSDGARVEFRSLLVGEAIEAGTPEPLRAMHHRRIGLVLAERAAPAVVVAPHLAYGAQPGDRRAIRWLRKAAAQVALTDPAAAVASLGRALELASVAETKAAIAAELTPLLVRCQRVADAIGVARTGLSVPASGRTSGLLHIGLAEALEAGGDPLFAVLHLEQAAALVDLPHRQRARLHAQLVLARVWSYDIARARADAISAVELGKEWGEPALAATGHSALALVSALGGDVDRALGQAAHGLAVAASRPDPQRAAAHHLLAGMVRLHADRLDDASASLAAGRRLAEAAGDLAGQGRCLGYSALVGFLAGDWDDAQLAAEAGLDLAAESGTRAGLPFCYGVLGLIALFRDDAATARECLRLGHADLAAPGGEAAGVHVPVLLETWRDEFAGRPGEGVGRLGHISDLAAEISPAASCLFAADLAALSVGTDGGERARVIAERMEKLAPRMGTAATRGAALSCRADADGDISARMAAVDELRSSPRRLALALALERAAWTCLQHGRRGDADRLVNEALRAYQGLGARLAERRTRQRARKEGLVVRARSMPRRPASGWTSLTPAEREVLALVGRGLSNPAIASHLHISRRTVETHVSRLYAKLDIPNRVLLAAEAHRRRGREEG